MSEANPLWGAPRLHGELLKLGFDASQATVAKYMVRRPKPPSQTWRTFLTNHVQQIAAADFFVVPTATCRLLFVLLILAHERRRVVHIAITDHPTAAWTAQQFREAFPWDQAPKYLVHDRDTAFHAGATTAPAIGIDEVVIAELSGVRQRPMIISMPTTARPQRRYDHRLRSLVQRTGDVTIATDLGVPRSTARGWVGKAPKAVVSLDVTDLSASALQQEVLELRRRVKKLTALLRLALALFRSSGFTLTHERLPDGRAKMRILRAVDHAREFVPLRTLLRFLRLSPSRFHAWRRLQHACALNDQSSCRHTSPID
jgi:hypothetical protein